MEFNSVHEKLLTLGFLAPDDQAVKCISLTRYALAFNFYFHTDDAALEALK